MPPRPERSPRSRRAREKVFAHRKNPRKYAPPWGVPCAETRQRHSPRPHGAIRIQPSPSLTASPNAVPAASSRDVSSHKPQRAPSAPVQGAAFAEPVHLRSVAGEAATQRCAAPHGLRHRQRGGPSPRHRGGSGAAAPRAIRRSPAPARKPAPLGDTRWRLWHTPREKQRRAACAQPLPAAPALRAAPVAAKARRGCVGAHKRPPPLPPGHGGCRSPAASRHAPRAQRAVSASGPGRAHGGLAGPGIVERAAQPSRTNKPPSLSRVPAPRIMPRPCVRAAYIPPQKPGGRRRPQKRGAVARA
jgi:hypothetical protein